MMRTIKVTGKGKIAVKPDMIRLYVNKEELCHEYEDTLRRSTEDTELLKDLFEKLGFQRKDLKTVYFNVDTEYESYQDRDKSWKRRFEGYKYIHHMKIEFASDNKKLGQVLYALAHSSLKPEFSIEYTVADVEKCKNELLHKAIEDSIQKAQVLTTAANVKLGEIQAIDYSWGEIDFVTKPMNEMRLMECTECEMSAPAAYDIDIEADDIDVTDTVTVVWEIAQEVDCMLSSIYYGEIQSDKLVSWNENKDPYNILVENNRVYKLGGQEFLDIANKLFDNEKQVDWGSYAYQCTKEQLEKLMEQTGCEIDKINELASEKIYGIVFVEEG